MTVEELISLRKAMGLNQTEMAEKAGLSIRAYQNIENRVAPFREVNQLAFERVGLSVALEKANPMLAPEAIRKDAIALSRLIGAV